MTAHRMLLLNFNYNTQWRCCVEYRKLSLSLPLTHPRLFTYSPKWEGYKNFGGSYTTDRPNWVDHRFWCPATSSLVYGDHHWRLD